MNKATNLVSVCRWLIAAEFRVKIILLWHVTDSPHGAQNRRRGLSFSPVGPAEHVGCAAHTCSSDGCWLRPRHQTTTDQAGTHEGHSHRKAPVAKCQSNESCCSEMNLDLMSVHRVHTSQSNVSHTRWIQIFFFSPKCRLSPRGSVDQWRISCHGDTCTVSWCHCVWSQKLLKSF